MAELSLGGVVVGLELGSGPASGFLAGLLPKHRTKASPTVRLSARPGRPPVPQGTPCWRHGRVTIVDADGSFWVRGGETIARVARNGAVADIYEPPSEQSEGWDRATASAALFLLLRAHQRHSIHAAAVEWRGTGYLIAGPSGAGKSTLSVLMALNGGCLRSDDTTLLGADARLWPLAQSVRLDPRSLRAHPEVVLDGSPGVKSEATVLHPQGGVMSADVLLFPTLAARGGLSAHALSPGEALRRLLAASPYATERTLGDPAPHLAALAALANGAASFGVTSGPDLLDAPFAQLELLPQK